MISIDSETQGIDFWHGAKPFFVTTCNEDGRQTFWEWDVDPLTREPEIPEADIKDIRLSLCSGDELVLQNAKFDVTALNAIGTFNWPWKRTHDTLIAGHVLSSNLPHDLTSMAMQYLGIDIESLEKKLEAAVKEARTIARRDYPHWRIAKKGDPSMPSAKEETWKFDSWLPKALIRQWEYEVERGVRIDDPPAANHPWRTVLADYANADSAITIQLWGAMNAELERRDLTERYEAKMRTLPVLFDMERRGVTVSTTELGLLRDEYTAEKAEMAATCERIAAEFDYDLSLPKAGNNKSLTEFAFKHLNLPVLKTTDTGNPSLDKDVIAEYRVTLDGEQLEFVKALSGCRKRAKSLEYLDSYEKHGRIADEFGDCLTLHPHVNPTGTATTRLSMSNPNLQQVSKQETACDECNGDGCDSCGGTGEDLHSVRRVFVPAEGRELWTADASNIELRIPAYKSGQPELIALFEKPDEPPYYGSQHLLNFSIVYTDVWAKELKAVGYDKVGPHCKKKYAAAEYQWCKNGDFALQYQCGDETGDRAFRRRGACRLLRSKFDRLSELNAKTVTFAEKHGYVLTYGGYPLLCTRGNYGKVVPTVPLNYVVQGSAGEWMNAAMVRCYEQLASWQADGFDAFIALTVHDELMFDMPRGRGSEPWRTNLPRMRKLQSMIERGGEDIGVPTPVSVEYHSECWSKGRSLNGDT